MSLYEYRATLVRWKDADTCVLDVDLGFRHWQLGETFRLAGINAPDRQPAKNLATAVAENLCPPGLSVIVRTEVDIHDVDKTEKWGRWLATITVPTSRLSVNDLLVQMGAAVPWDGTGVRPEGTAA